MKFSAVDKVEHLEQDKSIEDKGEMSRVSSTVLQYGLVIRITIGEVRSSTSHSSTHNSIVPFVVRMSCEQLGVICVNSLRNEVLSHKDDDQNYDQLVNRLTNDVLEHGF